MKLLRAAFFLSLGFTCAANAAPQQKGSCAPPNLDQGWSYETAQKFWFTSQGSRMMPYAWFMALEAPGTSGIPVHSPAFMEPYGYIPALPSPLNPDGLPIGFAKDVGSSKTHEDEYIGLTCAACHTGSLVIGGKTVIVQGGPALANFWPFLTDVVAAVTDTLKDNAKFDRFAKTVLQTGNPTPADVNQLRAKVQTKLDDLNTRLAQNTLPPTPGNGRIDAFGHIFTHFLAQDLNIPSNAKPPEGPSISAPVSYPFLWDTPQHDVVQWNGSAPNSKFLELGPLSRNLGEVIGVFGEMKITPGRHIPFLPFLEKPPDVISSANLKNLTDLEDTVKTLWSPAWPSACMPLAKPATIAQGAQLYNQYCVRCHALIARKDPNRTVDAQLVELKDIVTDPTMAMNFSARKGQTGAFRNSPNLAGSIQQKKLVIFGSEGGGRDLLLAGVDGVLLHDEVPVDLSGLSFSLKADIGDLKGLEKALGASTTPRYKARPLNGIWATAPYLHNGSVPTLRDLLNSRESRPPTFYVGSRELDPKKVGLVQDKVPGAFLFDTSMQGNWNNGHEGPAYGTQLSDKEKDALVEFLKTL
jgi:processive rubber oxygenase RoxA-like protein